MKKKIGGILICMLIVGAGITITQANKPSIHENLIVDPLPLLDYMDQQQLVFNCDWPLYEGENNRIVTVTHADSYAQSFTPTYPILTRIKLSLFIETEPDFDLKVSIRDDLDGSDLTFVVISKDQVPIQAGGNSQLLTEVNFPDIKVKQGERYFIVLEPNTQNETLGAYLVSVNGYNHPNEGEQNVYPNGIGYNKNIYSWDGKWIRMSMLSETQSLDLKFVTFGRN